MSLEGSSLSALLPLGVFAALIAGPFALGMLEGSMSLTAAYLVGSAILAIAVDFVIWRTGAT